MLKVTDREKIKGLAVEAAQQVRERMVRPEIARKILYMSTFALAYAKRHSLPELNRLLASRHAATVSGQYWHDFAQDLRPSLSKLATNYPETVVQQEALLYFLGTLHRLRRVPDKDLTPTVSRPREAPPLVVSIPKRPEAKAEVQAAPQYSAGQRIRVTVKVADIAGEAELSDGTIIRKVNLYGCIEGQIISVRIVTVDGKGRIKSITR